MEQRKLIRVRGQAGFTVLNAGQWSGEGLTEKVEFKPRLVPREGGRHATMRAEGNSGEIGGKCLREAGLGDRVSWVWARSLASTE